MFSIYSAQLLGFSCFLIVEIQLITIVDDDGERTRITKGLLGNFTVADNQGNKKITKDILGNLTIDND